MKLAPSLLATSIVFLGGCVATPVETREAKAARSPDFPAWLIENAGRDICIRGPVGVSIHSRSFELQKPDDIIAPHSGKVELPFSQRQLLERGIETGDVITACGTLRAEPLDPTCRALFCRNYLLLTASIES